MNKKDLISRATEALRNNNIRKPVSSQKHIFHISDDEGNHKDFSVKQSGRSVLYNTNDVGVILDACLSVIQDAIKRGEDVSIHGFGSLGVHKRAARQTKHPVTGEIAEVREHYVPKFSFGNTLRMAARLYELSLKDFDGIQVSEPYQDEDDEIEEVDTDGD